MILSMTLAWWGARILRMIPCLAFAAFFGFHPAWAGRWDPQGAALAYEEASQKRSEIAGAASPSLDQYLECARTYRKVYLRDPHYSRAGDAIYAEGLIYEEMGEKFAEPAYYKTAVKRFQLLVTDYGGNSNCPNSLLHIADICFRNLKDENAAQEAYRRLRTQYGYSDAAIQLARREAASKPAPPQAMPANSSMTQDGQAETASIQSIRYWSTSDYTRVIVDMDRDAHYEKQRIPDPDRIFFDISNAKLSRDLLNQTIIVGDECLKQVRVAQNRPDTVRVVLDLASAGEDSVSELHDPFRIVIDLHRQKNSMTQLSPVLNMSNPGPEETGRKAASVQTIVTDQAAQKVSQPSLHQDMKAAATSARVITSKAQQAPRAVTEIGSPTPEKARPAAPPVKAAPVLTAAAEKKGERTRTDFGTRQAPKVVPDTVVTPKAATPTSHGDRTLTRILGLKIGRIVIDPGHGGHDQGTMGPRGLLEKNLVLSLAHDLQKLLQEKLGAEVILTRNDDTFVSLEERTAIANRHKADLFVSIHANYSRIRSISGVETYFLNFAQTEAEREIAARENATTVNNVRDLEDLIKKIAQADKSVESKELASIIQKKLYSGARRLLPMTQNRGVRSAPFVVLIGANMPSVLVEVAFISNPKDERLLSKNANQERIAKSLFYGIEGYMKTLGIDVAHNLTVQSK